MAGLWTKGPWPIERTGDGKRIIIGYGLVDGPNGYEIAEVYSDDCDQQEAEANANLIAASPDLYNALAAFDRLMVAREAELGALSDEMVVVVMQARTALAKARGEV